MTAAATAALDSFKILSRRLDFRPRITKRFRFRLAAKMRAETQGTVATQRKPLHTAPGRSPAPVVTAGLDCSQPGTALLHPERQRSRAEREARRAQRHLSGQLLSSSPERAARRIAWALWHPELAICGVGSARDGAREEDSGERGRAQRCRRGRRRLDRSSHSSARTSNGAAGRGPQAG